jgi:hypothetical protein
MEVLEKKTNFEEWKNALESVKDEISVFSGFGSRLVGYEKAVREYHDLIENGQITPMKSTCSKMKNLANTLSVAAIGFYGRNSEMSRKMGEIYKACAGCYKDNF